MFLFNQLKSDVDFIKYFSKEDWSLYSNINDAKQNMEKKLKEEELNEEYYNISNNKYFTASTRSTSLSSSYRMYLPIMKQNE